MTRVALALAGVLLTSCSGGEAEESGRSVTILSADDAPAIVVPDDAFSNQVEVTLPPTTWSSPESTAPAATAATTTEPPTTAAPPPTEVAAASATTEPPRATVPLEEEEVSPGVRLLDTLDRFNTCLAGEGHSWLGMPDVDAGAEAPQNQPDYINALVLCNGRTNIASVFQEFVTSRSNLGPDEIRQQNENFIALVDCLRGRGWQIAELTPDENGLLSPEVGGFASADGDVDTGQIRDCAGEVALEREESNGDG